MIQVQNETTSSQNGHPVSQPVHNTIQNHNNSSRSNRKSHVLGTKKEDSAAILPTVKTFSRHSGEPVILIGIWIDRIDHTNAKS